MKKKLKIMKNYQRKKMNLNRYNNSLNIIRKYKSGNTQIKSNIIKLAFYKTAEYLKLNDCEINLILCSDKFIEKLNRNYRNINNPTDVLSFQINEFNQESGRTMLGEIIISLEKTKQQSEQYSVSFINELFRLFVHGILHLTGVTHETPDKLKIMNRKTDAILKKILYA